MCPPISLNAPSTFPFLDSHIHHHLQLISLYCAPTASMTASSTGNWKDTAKAKKDAIDSQIPQPWRLNSPIPSVEQQKDVTGKYIQQFLSQREVEITETDPVGIVHHTTTGEWKAEEVTKAFCHRAALAHQLVHLPLSRYLQTGLTRNTRSTVSTRSSSMLPLRMQKDWMPTSLNTRSLSVLYMDYLLV